jgi:uncharacterized membrane protein YoaK (UPF0700 family)
MWFSATNSPAAHPPGASDLKSITQGILASFRPARRRRRSLGQEIRRKHKIRTLVQTVGLVVGAIVVVALSVALGRVTTAFDGSSPLITRTK